MSSEEQPGGDASADEVRRSALFFVLTLASVTLFSIEGLVYGFPASHALAFSLPLLAILGAHEMGHYLVARRHGFHLSLPLFVPFPSGFGTMGAIIRLRSPPRSRQALLEMGVAGPLAGAVVAFLVLALTLGLDAAAPELHPWAPLVWLDAWLAKTLGPAEGPPQIAVFNDPMIVRVIGAALPGGAPGRYDVLHPAALAGWVGCLLTGINLLPIGQLDGGHVFNAVFPRASRRISLVLAAVLLAAGWFWPGWFVWGAFLLFFGAARPLPVAEQPALPTRARLLALAALILFLLTFMPVPIEIESLPAPG